MGFNLVKNTSEFYWARSFIAAFKDDNSVVFYFFAPAVVHMSVEYVLGLRDLGLHLPSQIRVMLGLILSCINFSRRLLVTGVLNMCCGLWSWACICPFKFV